MIRLISAIFFCLFFINFSFGAVYTFHTAGSYTNAGNWDVYPGTDLLSDDTISIEANIFNIDLLATDGYVVFAEDVVDIQITNLFIMDNCQLEFLASFFNLGVTGEFTYMGNNQILIPNGAFIFVSNFGNGINFNTCPIWDFVHVEYNNYGVQGSFLIECMEGDFYNYGIIEVDSELFILNFDLYLEEGTIDGMVPFAIDQFNGSFNQTCETCSATINNIEHLQLNANNTINGTVILNAPD